MDVSFATKFTARKRVTEKKKRKRNYFIVKPIDLYSIHFITNLKSVRQRSTVESPWKSYALQKHESHLLIITDNNRKLIVIGWQYRYSNGTFRSFLSPPKTRRHKCTISRKKKQTHRLERYYTYSHRFAGSLETFERDSYLPRRDTYRLYT